MFYLIGSIRAGILVFGFFVLLLLVLTACGAGNSDSEASEYDLSRNDSGMSGEIEIDGSSTVYPISEAVAEEFNKLYPNVRVNVGISGTGGGFKRFTIGETEISDASRPMKNPGETSKAVENGIKYAELRLGTDGISVMVNLENTFVDCLTTEELRKIWEPGSSIDNWSQVRSGFPDQKMRLYGPDTDSGTFDYFTEEIMGEAQLSRPDYTASADDNVLIQGIAGDKGALGYFGYAYYRESKDKLKLVAVDNDSGCVLPSLTTIPSGEYSPLSRPLFLYVNLDSLDKPEVKALVDFYMEHGPALTNEVGYVAAGTEVYQNNMEILNK